MLDELAVANLGVIRAARLEPGPGLVVVTGETGAGKTLLLGALRLIGGGTAAADLVGPHADEARVEGRFAAGGTEVVLARRIVAGGRSRAYRDGEMVPAKALGELTSDLVEMVGQHDAHALRSPAALRAMVDGALDAGGRAALASYREAWERLRTAEDAVAQLGGDLRALERERDLARYQADEIAAAGFAPGEDEELAARARRLRNADALAAHVQAAAAAIGDDEGGGSLAVAARELERAARLDPAMADLAGQARDLVALGGDLAADLARQAGDIEADPRALAAVEERLATLAGLQRKYGPTLAAVLDFGAAMTARAAEVESLLARAEGVDAEVAAAHAAVAGAGDDLTAARRGAAKRLADAAVGHLRELGLRDPVVRFSLEPVVPGPHGADRVGVDFASDAALQPAPAAKAASGGELSRLVLALRLAAGAGEAPVVAFDEVDAGVGGATALALGRKLAALAEGRQILCVTHLPQVAAFAATHYVVDRDGNDAAVRRVAGGDRVAELSRMLSGLPESDRGREHAAELLELAARG